MGYCQVRYDSRVINFDRRAFIRLATGGLLPNELPSYWGRTLSSACVRASLPTCPQLSSRYFGSFDAVQVSKLEKKIQRFLFVKCLNVEIADNGLVKVVCPTYLLSHEIGQQRSQWFSHKVQSRWFYWLPTYSGEWEYLKFGAFRGYCICIFVTEKLTCSRDSNLKSHNHWPINNHFVYHD